ncbi:hypothetical protein BB558_005570 [Smittium angustum]|uniref:RING-type E3 ubiquitin transferase n=1 Tax=Smittium angustum TaxID=133377 RepID=A0A2U1J057_SMIAN|nr:hypothetical protein BB558_005570 [Smittium angustum]
MQYYSYNYPYSTAYQPPYRYPYERYTQRTSACYNCYNNDSDNGIVITIVIIAVILIFAAVIIIALAYSYTTETQPILLQDHVTSSPKKTLSNFDLKSYPAVTMEYFMLNINYVPMVSNTNFVNEDLLVGEGETREFIGASKSFGKLNELTVSELPNDAQSSSTRVISKLNQKRYYEDLSNCEFSELEDAVIVSDCNDNVDKTFVHVDKQARANKPENNVVIENLYTRQHDCLICFKQIEMSDYIRSIPCYHAFHKQCIDNYLTNYNCCCPICKLDLTLTPKKDHNSKPKQNYNNQQNYNTNQKYNDYNDQFNSHFYFTPNDPNFGSSISRNHTRQSYNNSHMIPIDDDRYMNDYYRNMSSRNGFRGNEIKREYTRYRERSDGRTSRQQPMYLNKHRDVGRRSRYNRSRRSERYTNSSSDDNKRRYTRRYKSDSDSDTGFYGIKPKEDKKEQDVGNGQSVGNKDNDEVLQVSVLGNEGGNEQNKKIDKQKKKRRNRRKKQQGNVAEQKHVDKDVSKHEKDQNKTQAISILGNIEMDKKHKQFQKSLMANIGSLKNTKDTLEMDLL